MVRLAFAAALMSLAAVAAAAAGSAGSAAGTGAFLQGDAGELAREYQSQLDVNPFDADALNNLAVTKAEQGDVYSAEKLLQRALKIEPNNSRIQQNLQRVRDWQQVESSEFVPPTNYALPEGFGEQGLPPAPPPLWAPRR